MVMAEGPVATTYLMWAFSFSLCRNFILFILVLSGVSSHQCAQEGLSSPCVSTHSYFFQYTRSLKTGLRVCNRDHYKPFMRPTEKQKTRGLCHQNPAAKRFSNVFFFFSPPAKRQVKFLQGLKRPLVTPPGDTCSSKIPMTAFVIKPWGLLSRPK